MVRKKSGDITKVDDIDDGGGEGQLIEESYSSILNKLGVDTQEMSVEDIRNMIQHYSQEGLIKGAKVINLSTGKAQQTYKTNIIRTTHTNQ